MTYLRGVLNNQGRKEAIDEAVLVLKKCKFESIVVRGVSGLLVGPAVAMKLNKRLFVIRKPGDGSHSINTIEGLAYLVPVDRYVIIDDFVAAGDTVRAIIEAVQGYANPGKLVGVFQYHCERINGDRFREVFVSEPHIEQLDNGMYEREGQIRK